MRMEGMHTVTHTVTSTSSSTALHDTPTTSSDVRYTYRRLIKVSLATTSVISLEALQNLQNYYKIRCFHISIHFIVIFRFA